MNAKPMVVTITSFAMFLCLAYQGLAQSQPVLSGTLKPGGVSSRNMELLDIIDIPPENIDQFETAAVTYPVGSTTITRTFIVVSTDDAGPCLKLIDVTNPRSSSVFLRLRAQGSPTSSTSGNVTFKNYQVYKDTRTAESNTFNGDVFLVVWAGEVLVRNESPLANARFMVINLTKACTLVDGAASNEVLIHDASARNVTLGTTVTGNKDVYLGFIRHDLNWMRLDNGNPQTIHGLSVDPESGIMVMTPNKLSRTGSTPFTPIAHIDCFDLSTISTIITPGGSVLGEVARLKTGSTDEPIALTGLSNDARGVPRDVYIKKLSSGNVRLTMAVPQGSNTFVHAGTTYNYFGGVITRDMNYSNPSSVTLSNKNEWAYDSDRDTPLKRFSTNTDWQYRICHTAIPFYHTSDDVYVLTSDELANPKWNPLEPNSVNAHSIVGGAWSGGIDKLFVDGTVATLQDDRRVGSFTRIWRAEEGSSGLELQEGSSVTNRDGPMTYYDPIESIEPDDLYYAAGRTADPSDRSIATTASYGTSSSNRLAPTATHRPYAVAPWASNYDANNNDVYTSNYAQGVRVVNLTDIESTNHPVLEKGFFDFIPLLTYDANDPYFYKLSPQGVSQYGNFVQNASAFPIYWLGVLHCVPDFGPSRVGTSGSGTLLTDEKFVYALAKGEGKLHTSVTIAANSDVAPDNPGITISADPSDVTAEEARNWLPKGGYLVLRYFDGKLGGTIKGYEGTGSTPRKWSRRPYQTINLQGDFTVERDVTVAAGACVQLLPGHESDPGIFASTSLLPPSSGTKTIYVDGILNFSVPEGDDLGTDIVIDVPIVVRDGGVLNVYNIRNGKKVIFKKAVVCSLGGTWKMHAGANVELVEKMHTCHGKLLIEGTSTKRVTIKGKTAAGLGHEASITGRPVYSSSPISGPFKSAFIIHYADCENTFFDMKNFQTKLSTKEVLNSTFLRTVPATSKSALVRIDQPFVNEPLPFFFAFVVIDIENCTFSNTYAGEENPSGKGFGADINRSFIVSVANSDFGNMYTGAIIANSFMANVAACNYEDNAIGLFTSASLGQVCTSNFIDNEFSSVAFAKSEMYFYDNQFTGCVDGISAWSGGRFYLRNNDFGAYLYGINAKATTLYLRDLVYGEQDYEFGRNDFNSPAATFQFPGWGAARNVYDIVRGPFSILYVDCGQNDFNANSTYHVFGRLLDGAFDASDNRWAVAGGYFWPRTNLNYTGANFNTQEDPNNNCGLVEVDSPCGPPTCPSLIPYIGLTSPTSGLYTAIATLNSDITNTGYSVACRKAKAWELVGALTRTDSTALAVQAKSSLATVATNTALVSDLRSTAYMAKAKIHEHIGELDSAQAVYTTILTSFTSGVDSVTANWSMNHLAAVLDTVGAQDSLMHVHIARVLFDLRRTITEGGMSKSNLISEKTKTSLDSSLTCNGIVPNPTSGQCSIDLLSDVAGLAQIEIVDLTGTVIRNRVVHVNAGSTSVVEDVSLLARGMYFVRVSRGGASVTLPLMLSP